LQFFPDIGACEQLLVIDVGSSDGVLKLLSRIDLGNEILLLGQVGARRNVVRRSEVHFECVIEEAIIEGRVGEDVFLGLPVVVEKLRFKLTSVLLGQPAEIEVGSVNVTECCKVSAMTFEVHGHVSEQYLLLRLFVVRVGCSSPIVVRVSNGLKPGGDCVQGSGDVPHDELGPPLEFEDTDGEAVLPPLRLNDAESRLVREPLVPNKLSYPLLNTETDLRA